MDFVVLLALGGTIYYVMRLSTALNDFKKYRAELEKLILELTTNIDQAQGAIAGLKKTSDTAANDLDDVLHDARRMAEELKMINETSDSLATRLEQSARGARVSSVPVGEFDDMPDDEGGFAAEYDDEDEVSPSFFIQDTEFERRDENEVLGGEDDEFASQAERELYEALLSKKAGRGA